MALRIIRALFFAILAPGSVTVLVPALILSVRPGPVSVELGVLSVLGFILLTVGAGLFVWCYSQFVVEGRGTPAPYDPPVALVVRGPYRWVRNPIYVAVTAVLLGEAAVFGSVPLLGYAALVWWMFHLYVVAREEPVLRLRFGRPYEEYLRRVPRWIPRRPRVEG